tara:strand:- start:61 stop:627 length:567 start_codon:yes stop_codon:yes gene_type:complete
MLFYIDKHLLCKIFRKPKPGYGGSPFYYYVPLLSFLYYSYSKLNKKYTKELNKKYTKEEAPTRKQIISGFDYCGLTNLIKCSTNSPDGRSKPSEAMDSNCIKKFKNELDVICPKVLVIFTRYNHPSLLVDYFNGFSVTSEKERYRIQKKDNLYVLELEHPVSTKIKRERKYQSYSNAIYEVVELQKQQ